MKKYWFLLLLVSCGPSKEDTKLAEAASIHDEASETAHRASLVVSQLKSLEVRLDQPQSDTLNAIADDLSEWYESLMEVPGHEHDEHNHDGHDHSGHDHDHGHQENYLEGLSSDEVLKIQAEIRKEIQWIEARVIKLMSEVQQKDNQPS